MSVFRLSPMLTAKFDHGGLPRLAAIAGAMVGGAVCGVILDLVFLQAATRTEGAFAHDNAQAVGLFIGIEVAGLMFLAPVGLIGIFALLQWAARHGFMTPASFMLGGFGITAFLVLVVLLVLILANLALATGSVTNFSVVFLLLWPVHIGVFYGLPAGISLWTILAHAHSQLRPMGGGGAVLLVGAVLILLWGSIVVRIFQGAG
ncbi:hypothetical protein CDZ96_22640 [Mameliella alba]|nr:hypothetical protein CDZ96_22640 [Mameliella alba]GGF81758.1 hypothetical protein GCM10011319_47310 [Mameliella alba]